MPSFNSASTIERALRSALDQEGLTQLVVVDDGSTDDSAEVAQAIGDPRITVVSQPNAGPSASRNTGVAEVRAERVVFLDADDELLPGALKTFTMSAPDDSLLVRAGVHIEYEDGS